MNMRLLLHEETGYDARDNRLGGLKGNTDYIVYPRLSWAT